MWRSYKWDTRLCQNGFSLMIFVLYRMFIVVDCLSGRLTTWAQLVFVCFTVTDVFFATWLALCVRLYVGCGCQMKLCEHISSSAKAKLISMCRETKAQTSWLSWTLQIAVQVNNCLQSVLSLLNVAATLVIRTASWCPFWSGWQSFWHRMSVLSS